LLVGLGALGDFGMAKLLGPDKQGSFTTMTALIGAGGAWTETSFKDYYRPIELQLINANMGTFLGPEFNPCVPIANPVISASRELTTASGEGTVSAAAIFHPNLFSCDIYALGMLLFILTTKEEPFHTPTSKLKHVIKNSVTVCLALGCRWKYSLCWFTLTVVPFTTH
jgi:serine/threonine protein kinase